MASTPLARPETGAGRHGDALSDVDHTIKMCFNPATAAITRLNINDKMKSDLVPDEGIFRRC